MRAFLVGNAPLACAALVLVASTGGANDKILRQSWDNLHHYGGVTGLSPLYEATAAACQRILIAKQRWAILPRPIDRAFVRPDDPPCFEMHSGDAYYNDLKGNVEGIRWANEQAWDGAFRLFYNTTVLGRDGDDFWLTVDGFSPALQLLAGNAWTRFRPPAQTNSSRTGGPAFAKIAGKGWCVATSEGVFLVVDGAWQRPKITNWPGGAAEGVVSDAQGRLAIWSARPGAAGSVVAVLAGAQWATVELALHHRWANAAIRADGAVVLAGDSAFAIARPESGDNVPQPRARGGERQDEIEHLRRGHFDLGDRRWVQPVGVPAVGRGGSALFAAVDLLGQGPMGRPEQGPGAGGRPRTGAGLVRVTAEGAPEWINFEVPPTIQIVPWLNDGFMLMIEQQGIYLLEKDARKPSRVADANELLPGDKLLGGDRGGLAYINRGPAVLTFNYQEKRTASIEPEEIARLDRAAGRHRNRSDALAIELRSAVDSSGNCWFASSEDGAVMVKRARNSRAIPVGDRPTGAESLWPGRDGSVLALGQNVALLVKDGADGEQAQSLVALAKDRFDRFLAAAPVASCDSRRPLESRADRLSIVPPWLTTGKCVWVTDGGFVYRMRNKGADAKDPGPIEVDKVCVGDFDILGPLRSGHLLLAKRAPPGTLTEAKVTEWFCVADPEGRAALLPLAAPPARNGEGTLERPDGVTRQWLQDSNGALYVHQGFDRVYRIDAAGKWPLLSHFGVPAFEYPSGVVWAWHSSRVFAGYEVAADGFRRSCIPSYLNDLTPLFADEGAVWCLTPLGFAVLRFDRDRPAEDALVNATRVAWTDAPAAFIGRAADRAFFVTSGGSGSKLVSIALSSPMD